MGSDRSILKVAKSTEKGKFAMRKNLFRWFRVAAATAVLAACGTTWAGSKPINLLPLGDSITSQGYYISPLETLLTNKGYAPYLLANEGHSGFIIQGNIPGTPARAWKRTSTPI